MPDLVWSDVADRFEVDGSLRDVYVFGASTIDWQRVIDLVRTRGWCPDYTVDGASLPLPEQISAVFEVRSEASATLFLRLAADIHVNTHFFSDDEIQFDFDPGELQGQDRLDALCAFLRGIGSTLDKPVVFTPENTPHRPLLTYTPSDDCVTASRREVRKPDVT